MEQRQVRCPENGDIENPFPSRLFMFWYYHKCTGTLALGRWTEDRGPGTGAGPQVRCDCPQAESVSSINIKLEDLMGLFR